jgi:manganese transport protein
MTATQAEFTATDAGLPVAGQQPALTAGPSAVDRLLARGRIRGVLAMLGPAFVASVAYVDPGNFATNIQGGAQYGYLLLWVVLAANVMAMVVQ